jgi:uncharacterized RDD family membrane protein YckC
MICHYCQASNTSVDHRCQRCGRRWDDSNYRNGGASAASYSRTATARSLRYEQETAEAERAPEQTGRHRPYQPPLFSTRVVSFESYAPESKDPKSRTRISFRPRAKRPIPGQDSFAFDTVITQGQPPRKDPAPNIGCDARAAKQVYRIVAAAFDFSLVIVSVSLFVGVFFLLGGRFILDMHSAPVVAGMAAAIYLLYELLWCFANSDTPGMRFADLRLIHFDGRPPNREQRLIRAASGCLSLFAAGLGILWAWVDEESLTWHDHMSKTFPTAR